MLIQATQFGSITIDDQTYDHDVVIRLSGAVIQRKKKLSKRYYGTSHILSEEEIRFVLEPGCRVLIIGTGQSGQVTLSQEAESYLESMACRVELAPTPEAIHRFNREQEQKKIGLFHITC